MSCPFLPFLPSGFVGSLCIPSVAVQLCLSTLHTFREQRILPLYALVHASKTRANNRHTSAPHWHKSIYLFVLVSVILTLYPFLSAAKNYEQRPGYSQLFEYACAKFGLPKVLVMAIARQESSGDPLCINVAGKDVRPKTIEQATAIAQACLAKGYSCDLGLMQINTLWIRKYNIPVHLLFRPKDNIFFGCFILNKAIRSEGALTWKAVGRYHSSTPWRRDDYASRIRRHVQNILLEQKTH